MRVFFMAVAVCLLGAFAPIAAFAANVLVPQQKDSMPGASSGGSTLPSLGLSAAPKSHSRSASSSNETMDPAAELRQKKVQRLMKKNKVKSQDAAPTGGPAD